MIRAAEEFTTLLNEQLSVIEHLCCLYDNGDHAAATSIAAMLTALLDDSANAHPAALLERDRQNIGFHSFISTAYPEEAHMESGFRLCLTEVTSQQSTKISYTPKLGGSLPWYKTSFANWWNNEVVINEVVVPQDYHLTFSRHKLCLFLQNKGAAMPGAEDAELEPFFASIRHIAFEFMESMRAYYSKNTPP